MHVLYNYLFQEHYATAVKLKTFPMRVELGNGEVSPHNFN
jgi:hypothetical protein